MLDLFVSECRRFGRATLIFAAAHLGLQLFLARILSVPNLAWEMQVLALLVVTLSGMGLALYQIGSYTQPNRWLWLMHRPLPRRSIFSALSLAAALAITIAIGLPVLLAMAGTHYLSAQPIELRHYLSAPYLALMALNGWLAGAAIMLSRRWFSAMVLFLPYVLVMHEGAAWRVLLAALACSILMVYVAYGYFQPDRTAAPAGKLAAVFRAAPLAIGCYFVLLWACGLGFQAGQLALGSPSMLAAAAAPPDGFIEAKRMDGRTLLVRGLADAHETRAQAWRGQVGEVKTLRPQAWVYPVPQQLSNRSMPVAQSVTGRLKWIFSHDAMLFKTIDTQTGEPRGWFGMRGIQDRRDTQAFPDIPYIANGNLVTPHLMMQLDVHERAAVLRARLPQDEQFVPFLGSFSESYYYALSNRRLIAYAPDAQQPDGLYRERYSVLLPGPLSDLSRIDMSAVADGALVSVTGGRAMSRGQPGGKQTVFLVDAAGHAVVVAERALSHDNPALYEYSNWYLSPLLDYLTDLPDQLFMDGKVPDVVTTDDARPPIVLAAAVLGSVLAVVGAWFWLRPGQRSEHRLQLGAWLLACALLGLPGLGALMAMQARAPRRRAAAGLAPLAALA